MTVFGLLAYLVGFFLLLYLLALVAIGVLRRALWLISTPFFLLDQLTWFLYNPLRSLMKDRESGYNRFGFYLMTFFLLKPIWQLSVWVLTLPVRFITALYFDVLMYLFIMVSDGFDELFFPKLGAMRFKKGSAYVWSWVLGFPYRFGWFIVKNAIALLDSLMMLIVSLGWPTFTMFHGTSQNNVVDISKKNRWLVGTGNYGGSGIYFGSSISTAAGYAFAARNPDGKIIIARVTLSMVRNCGTLRENVRKNVARPGEGGAQLAQQIRFPYFATEFWRADHKWWEYCLLQGGKDGQFVKSWRIRPIGFVDLKEKNILSGRLQRLWGGKGHYALSTTNLVMTAVSLGLVLFQLWLASQWAS